MRNETAIRLARLGLERVAKQPLPKERSQSWFATQIGWTPQIMNNFKAGLYKATKIEPVEKLVELLEENGFLADEDFSAARVQEEHERYGFGDNWIKCPNPECNKDTPFRISGITARGCIHCLKPFDKSQTNEKPTKPINKIKGAK